ncbi:MAG TPA: hypothetical protein VGA04_12145 [Streptosporangiaceae bacterium]
MTTRPGTLWGTPNPAAQRADDLRSAAPAGSTVVVMVFPPQTAHPSVLS